MEKQSPDARRSWLGRTAPAVLSLLVGAAILFLCQWEQVWILRIASSRDGAVVATGSGVWGRHRRKMHVTLWDESLQVKRRIPTLRLPLSLAFSPDGSKIAVGQESGAYRIYDVKSGRELTQYQFAQDQIHSMAFTPDGRALTVLTYHGGCRIMDLDNNTLDELAGEIDAHLSPRGGKLLLRRAPPPMTLEFYDLSNNRFDQLWTGPGTSFPVAASDAGTSIVGKPVGLDLVDPAGNLIAPVLVGSGCAFNNTGDRLLCQRPAGIIEMQAANGKRIRVVPAKTSALGGLMHRGEDNVVATAGGNVLQQWNLNTGATRRVKIQRIQGPVVWLLAAFAVIGFAWWGRRVVQRGLRSSWRQRPLADLLLINALGLGALVFRATRLHMFQYTGSIEVALLLGTLAGYVGLFVLWLVMGSRRAAARAPWFLAALALSWAALRAFGRGNVQMDSVIVAATLIVLVTVCLTAFRLFGGRLSNSEAPPAATAESSAQVNLRDILLVTASCGLLTAVGRHTVTYGASSAAILLFALHGLGIGAICLSSFWLALGQRHLWLRWTVVLLIAPAVGAATVLGKNVVPLNSRLWYILLSATTAATVLGCLYIYRRHGYRLTRGGVPAES